MRRVATESASWVQPDRRSWRSRHVRISAADTSMAESTPKPTRLTDPAARPAATAITPSIPFQPMVAAFSQRARCTAASRTEWAWPAWSWRSGAAIEVLVEVVDLELEVDEVGQRVGQAGRREVVAHLAPLSRRPDETAPAQAGEVVGHVRPRDAEVVGQRGGIRGTVAQGEEDAPSRRIGQRRPHPFERVLHADHGTAVAVLRHDASGAATSRTTSASDGRNSRNALVRRQYIA